MNRNRKFFLDNERNLINQEFIRTNFAPFSLIVDFSEKNLQAICMKILSVNELIYFFVTF